MWIDSYVENENGAIICRNVFIDDNTKCVIIKTVEEV